MTMQLESLDRGGDRRHGNVSLRDVTAVLFRQRKPLISSFVVILLLVIVLSGALSPSYVAETKILVRHGRMDPVVTSQSNAPQQVMPEEITDSELNSEVELLNSRDLLRKVVLANGLQTNQRSLLGAFGKPKEDVEIARAVRELGKRLKVDPVRKTNIILITYKSSDPDQAARVLNTLGSLYLEKHLAVHRPSGSSRSLIRKPRNFAAVSLLPKPA